VPGENGDHGAALAYGLRIQPCPGYEHKHSQYG
jgi:hypothetical protein